MSDKDEANGIDEPSVPEDNEEENKETQGVEIDAEFGILIMKNLNGEGYRLLPIRVETGRVLREASVDDVMSLVSTVHMFNQAQLTAKSVVDFQTELAKQKNIVKPGKRGIFDRGR